MPDPFADIDRQLAQKALEKRRDGKIPNARELAALRKIEKERDDKQREEHYRTVSKAEWRRWSGRQNKIIDAQGRRLGLPIAQAVISLPDFVRAFHDFLDRYKHQLQIDAPVMDEAELRLRVAKAGREELKLDLERGDAVPRVQVEADELRIIQWVVGVFERAGPELAVRIAGRRPAEVKVVTRAYFDAVRTEALKLKRPDPKKPSKKAHKKRKARRR
jgi:hypothetical protein